MPNKRNIRELSLADLKEYFESIGDKKFRAIQAYEWIWKKNARHFDDMSNLSLDLRKKLAEDFELNAITIAGIELAHRIHKHQFSFGQGRPRSERSLRTDWQRGLSK